MANGNTQSGNRGGGGSGNPSEVIAFVVIAFVIIFVVLLYAMGVSPTPALDLDNIGGSLGDKVIEVWREYLNPIFIILDLVVFGAFMFAVVKSWPYRPVLSLSYKRLERKRQKRKAPDYRKFKKGWQKITARLSENTPDAFRLAVIDADAFVDRVLKEVGYDGDHMADRLSQIVPGQLETLEGVWRAHRLRNNLVHAHGIAVTRKEAENAIRDYGAFLKEIGIL